MIDKSVYELGYIRELQKKYASDPGLIERALYAFGLLEAIKSVGMPFCFKGGTSLMLILDKPARLSTDIDILVEPGTENPVPVAEMVQRRDAWHAQYGHLLKGYSVAKFLEEKHEEVEKGLE